MTTLFDDVGITIGTLAADPMAIMTNLPSILDAVAASGTTTMTMYTFIAQMNGYDTVAAQLSNAGLRAGALEAALAWSKGPGDAVKAEAEQIVLASQALGADRVLTVVLEPEWDFSAAAEGLGQLCQLISGAGVKASIEFLPWTAMPTIASAYELVTACGEANAELLFDTWHWVRQPGGPDFETLRAFGGDRIGYVQLCDALPTAGPDVEREAMTERQLPGIGIVDFAGIFRELEALGAQPFVASEVLNAELLAQGADVFAARTHDACEALKAL